MIGHPLHEVRMPTGVIAVTVEDDKACGCRGSGLRSEITQLRIGRGDGLDNDGDDGKVTRSYANAEIRNPKSEGNPKYEIRNPK